MKCCQGEALKYWVAAALPFAVVAFSPELVNTAAVTVAAPPIARRVAAAVAADVLPAAVSAKVHRPVPTAPLPAGVAYAVAGSARLAATAPDGC